MSLRYKARVIFKGIWRDMITYWRYKAGLFGWFLEIVSMVLGFLVIGGAYYFAPELYDIAGLEGNDIFLFLVVGTAVQMFSGIATWGPLTRVEEDIHFGTIEAVFVTPAPRLGYLLSTTISRAIVSSIFFIPLYIIALALTGSVTNIAVIGITLLIALITIISLISIGLFFGMLAILFRQTRLLVTVINQLIQFFCGAYIPVQGYILIHPVFGEVLKYLAMIFPFTYNFDLMRYFMIDGYIPLLPIWLEFLILGGCTIVYLILARILLIPVERKAKKQGLSIL
jgi:ABC-type polysaccharide/polyol phosphate export permease